MKSSALAFCLFSVLSLNLLAQGGKLSGRVTDAGDGKGLFAVTVHVDNVNGTPVRGYQDVATETDGSYQVKGLQQGKAYKVTFSLDEYLPRIKEITVTATENPVLSKRYASSAYWGSTAARIRAALKPLH